MLFFSRNRLPTIVSLSGVITFSALMTACGCGDEDCEPEAVMNFEPELFEGEYTIVVDTPERETTCEMVIAENGRVEGKVTCGGVHDVSVDEATLSVRAASDWFNVTVRNLDVDTVMNRVFEPDYGEFYPNGTSCSPSCPFVEYEWDTGHLTPLLTLEPDPDSI